LSAWRDAPFFTDRERAALEWCEAVTSIADRHVPDEIYNAVKQSFTEEEMVNLTMAVITINGWNRLAIAFGAVAGDYQPARHTVQGGMS
jgi:alkylhydroperoxidase family enzyme